MSFGRLSTHVSDALTISDMGIVTNVLSGSGPLDVRIKRLAGQRDDLQDTVRRLKLDLEEERGRASLARGAADLEEAER